MNALSKIVWIISTVLLLVSVFYAHSLFAETVALHFNQDEIADYYITKDAYFNTIIGIASASAIIFLGLAAFIHRIPVQLLGIPKRSFWIQDKDHQYKARQIIARTLWTSGAAFNFLIIIGHLMIFDQNANFFETPLSYVGLTVVGMTLLFLSLISGILRLSYPRLDILELQTYSGSR